MTKEKSTIDKRNIQNLLRELGREDYSYTDPDVARLNDLIEKREAILQNDGPLKRLKAERDEAQEKFDEAKSIRLKAVAKIRKRFWAEGATPRVLKMLESFLDKTEGDL